MFRTGMWGVAATLTLAAALPLAAQESVEQLKKEIDALKAEVREMRESAAPKSVPISVDAKDSGLFPEVSDILEKIVRETKITGFVDAGYTFNMDRPANGLNGNTGDPGILTVPAADTAAGGSVRAFDNQSNAFLIHNAQLTFERVATKELIAGYKVEISMGSDSEVIDSTSDSDPDSFDLQEAYAQLLLPVGNGIDLKVGKFATLSGYEVIESVSNMNYSRSLLFFFAIPYTHTGVRATYQIIDEIGVTLGANNGWDNSIENNDAKTLEFQLAVTPLPWLKGYVTYYSGAEKARSVTGHDPGDKRSLVDVVVTATDIPGVEGLTLGINYDKGTEDGMTLPNGTLDDADWDGTAVYAKYQICEPYALALRYEQFNDREGVRTGTDNHISEFTLTNEFKVAANVIARLEYRMDKSDEEIFLDHKTPEDTQSTIGAELIITF